MKRQATLILTALLALLAGAGSAATPTPTPFVPTPVWTGAKGGANGIVVANYEAENGALIKDTVGTGAPSGYTGSGFVTAVNSGKVSITFIAPYTGDYKIEAIANDGNSTSQEQTNVEIDDSNGVAVNDTKNNGNATWQLTSKSKSWTTSSYVCNGQKISPSDPTVRIWRLTAATTYTVVFSTNQAGFMLDNISLCLDGDDLPPPGGSGLCANYYNVTDSAFAASPVYAGIDGQIDFNWNGGWPYTWTGAAPYAAVNTTYFETRWAGSVAAPYSGMYTFSVTADDGVRLYIKDMVTPLIDQWQPQSASTFTTSYYLTAGSQVALKMEYYQAGGNAVANLQWSSNLIALSDITAGYLYPGACAAPATPTRTATLTTTVPAPTITRTQTPAPGTATRTPTITRTFTPMPPVPTLTNTPAVPTVTLVSPNMGLTGGGNLVTIGGTNFYNSTTFMFGSSAATGLTFINSTTMTMLAPAGSGTVAVVANNGGYTSNTATTTADQYSYVPPIYQGLSPTTRLYGLEYIPFPEQGSGSSAFTSLDASFTALANNEEPKNTARWKFVLTGLSLTAANQGDAVAVETRIGPFGVSCTTGYVDSVTQGDNYNLQLPDRPQNLSTTYVFLTGTTVPATEQVDIMGDPRYVPYIDEMTGATTGFADGYNWFFHNLQTDASGAWYKPYIADAKFDRYLPQTASEEGPNVDVPKIYRLIREGVLMTRSVYTSISGWSNYYIGIGGEIGGDNSNNLPNAVQCYGGPWKSSVTLNEDEIIGAASWVRTGTWFSRPYIGELWPDYSYHSDWAGDGSTGTQANWGNLRNAMQGGDAYRDNITNFDATYATGGSYSAVYNFSEVRHRNEGYGCATFMNGTDGSTANAFNHNSINPYDAALMADGTTVGTDFNFAMPPTFSVTRPWSLTTWGSSLPPEWAMNPYKGVRTTMNIYSASPTAGFYAYQTGGAEDRSSGSVRMYDTAGAIDPRGLPSAGFFLINGLAPSTQSGFSFVARFAMLGCLRTFMDAGVPITATATACGTFSSSANKVNSNVFRIAPIPLVSFTSPTNNQDLSHYPNITLQWQERYARWDGVRYTENYPCTDGPVGMGVTPCAQVSTQGGTPSLEWHDGEPLVFNLKYSTDGGATWKSCLTDTPGQSGVYMPNADSIPYSPTYLYSYTWPVSSLVAGLKRVRVECYRVNYPQHYAYHELKITTAP